MGTEMKQDGYDAAYHRAKYLAHYSMTRWYPRFQMTASLMSKHENILEVGCGTGQLANLLFDLGFQNYKGFDFSEVGIDACKRLQLEGFDFFIGDAYNPKLYNNYDTIVCCEVLEHVKDFLILNNIEAGKKLVLTLPDFKAPNHLFHIDPKEENGISQIYDRYIEVIDIDFIKKIDAWYVIEGIKK